MMAVNLSAVFLISLILSTTAELNNGRGNNITHPPTTPPTTSTIFPIIVTPCKFSDDSCINQTFTPTPTDAPTIHNDTNSNNGRTNITYPPTVAITPTLSPIPSSNPNISDNDYINATYTPTVSPINSPTNHDSRNNITKTPTFITNIPTTNIPTITDIKDMDPTLEPTLEPTFIPTFIPSFNPTITTNIPTNNPSITPTLFPSFIPSITPTFIPSFNPTITTNIPTNNPSITPTLIPSLLPTINPTQSPTRINEGGVDGTEPQVTNIITELIGQKGRPNSENTSVINTGLIIGASICGVCIVIFCIVLCIKCRKILNENEKEEEFTGPKHIKNDITPDSEEFVVKTGPKTDDGFNVLMDMFDNGTDNIINNNHNNHNNNDDDAIVEIVNTTKGINDDDDIIEIVNETDGGPNMNKQGSRYEGMTEMVQHLQLNEFEVNDDIETNGMNMNDDMVDDVDVDVDDLLVGNGKETNTLK